MSNFESGSNTTITIIPPLFSTDERHRAGNVFSFTLCVPIGVYQRLSIVEVDSARPVFLLFHFHALPFIFYRNLSRERPFDFWLYVRHQVGHKCGHVLKMNGKMMNFLRLKRLDRSSVVFDHWEPQIHRVRFCGPFRRAWKLLAFEPTNILRVRKPGYQIFNKI